MSVYSKIFRKICDYKDKSEIPVSIEMNKKTHKELVEDMKSQMKSNSILSIERLFHLPIFINNEMKEQKILIKSENEKMDICVNCVEKYIKIEKPEKLLYSKEKQCEICHHNCKTTKISAKNVDFNKIKKDTKPNI